MRRRDFLRLAATAPMMAIVEPALSGPAGTGRIAGPERPGSTEKRRPGSTNERRPGSTNERRGERRDRNGDRGAQPPNLHR